MRNARPSIHALNAMPISVAATPTSPATASARAISSYCTNVATPVARMVTAEPAYGMMCTIAANTAHSTAWLTPNASRIAQVARPINELRTSIVIR